MVLSAEIIWVYAVMLVRVRRQGIDEIAWRTRRRCEARAVRASRAPEEREFLARRLSRAVSRTLTVLPTDSRCLMQSLVLTRLLSARSVPSRLVIGTRTDPPFMAHAWVECDGVAILPSLGYEDFRLAEF
jgi:hypothetical protein